MDIVEYKKIIAVIRPKLLLVAKRITKNSDDAEDVVQEVCLKIWHRRQQFAALDNVKAYSMQMAKNMSIDLIRSRRRISDEELMLTKEDGRQLPDEILEMQECHEAIRRIIKSLPPMQQRILQLKEIEGFDNDEIVKITGISPEAVRNNLSRARKRLRDIYLTYQNAKKGTNGNE